MVSCWLLAVVYRYIATVVSTVYRPDWWLLDIGHMNKCNFVIVLVHYHSGVCRLIIHGQLSSELFVSSCYSACSLCSKVKLCKVTWVLFVSGIGWGGGYVMFGGIMFCKLCAR